MNNYSRVLLATDFSEPANTLTECFFALCPDIETEISLVHVNDEDADPHSSSCQKAQTALDELEKKIRQAGYENITQLLVQGEAFEKIHAIAEESEVDLVLVASHQKGFLRSTLLGSTTFDLARAASYPLFIEKLYNETDSFLPLLSKLLIPTDFSKESLTALDFIRSLREHIGEVVFAHVIERSRNSEDLANKLEQAQQKLSELVEEVKLFGVKASYVVDKGSASKKLRSIAKKQRISLVVMAKIGGGLVKGLPLGSTSQNFALNSEQPLLLLPDSDEDNLDKYL